MFSLSVAWRFLIHSKAQTLLIILGIAVGVSVQIFIGGIITGLREDLIDTTIGNSSQVTVLPLERGGIIEEAVDLDAIAMIDQRIKAVSPVLNYPGVIIDEQTEAVLVRGFDFNSAEDIYQISTRIVEGDLPQNPLDIMLGKDLVEALDLKVNDDIELSFTKDGIAENVTLTLVGVFDFRVSQINETWLITSLSNAQNFLGISGISAIEMQLNDVFSSLVIAEKVSDTLGDSFRVTEWQSANQELLSGLEGQNISGLMIQVFVLISVLLGIASVLAITVVQKSKQLGILKAMGITNNQARLIFLYQGAILGLFGGILGILLGLTLSESFSAFATNPDGTPILVLIITPSFIILSASLAVLAALTASLIPARRSSKLSVIEVIRNG